MSDQYTANKRTVHELWERLNAASLDESLTIFAGALTDETAWHVSHPLNNLVGRQAVTEGYWGALKMAMPNLQREHYILMAAAEDERLGWLTATGYYRGTFVTDWLGFPVTGRPVNLRFGEFVRLEGGKIAEAYVIFDLVDMLRQAGREVLPLETGETGYVPGPVARDGVTFTQPDPTVTDANLQIVHEMIYDGLSQYDGQTLSSMGMKRYWRPDMLWYGPAGIGTTRGLKGFEDHHQRPFLIAFPDRKGGNHVVKFADGQYIASTGWPSITATHLGDYLGLPATGKPFTMRVMDWWRAEDGLLVENWVLLDLPHTFLQLGHDLFADFDLAVPQAAH